MKSLPFHYLDYIFGKTLLALKRQIALDKIAHSFLQAATHLAVDIHALQPAIVTTRDRMAYDKSDSRIKRSHRAVEHHTQRTDVATMTRRGVNRQKFNHFRSEDRKRKVFCLIVDTCADRHKWNTRSDTLVYIT